MAANSGGGWNHETDLHPDQAEHHAHHQGRGASVQGETGAEAPREVESSNEFQAEIRVRLTARRVRIDPEEKRARHNALNSFLKGVACGSGGRIWSSYD